MYAADLKEKQEMYKVYSTDKHHLACMETLCSQKPYKGLSLAIYHVSYHSIHLAKLSVFSYSNLFS